MKTETNQAVCKWQYDDCYGYYKTACGQSIWFEDGLADRAMNRFCGCCGRPIDFWEPAIESEEDELERISILLNRDVT